MVVEQENKSFRNVNKKWELRLCNGDAKNKGYRWKTQSGDESI